MSLLADVGLVRPGFRLAVRIEVQPGEVLAVLGPNGSGKSTLISVLAGLVLPDNGEVRLGGRLLTGAGVHLPPYRRNVGLLAQDPLLFPHLSVLGNVAFGPRSQGARRANAERIARHWLSEVDGAELVDRKPRTLSGGQAQRVALARALAVDPALVLLDEPFASLDVAATPALRGLLRRVLRPRETAGRPADRVAVLVTHDPLDALMLSDRVVVLADGAIAESGPTRQVLSRPRTEFAARIAGLNLVPGTACRDGLRTADHSVVAGGRAPEASDGDAAVAVFQPAAVAVHTGPVLGSPRNVFPAVVAALEPRGDVIRVRARPASRGPAWVTTVAADVTPAAVAELDLAPGTDIFLAVKATEVAVYPTAGGPDRR
jgi:molybdate transport system ATP-binding protein